MSTTLTKSALAMLVAIGVASSSEAGCDFVVLKAPATVSLLEGVGTGPLIEVNEAMSNEKGEVAARITDAGRALVAGGADASGTAEGEGALNAAPAAAAPVAVKKTFVIETDVPLVEKTRQPPAEQYPFDALPVGGSFFVANDDVKSGNAYKTLNSTVNTANERYSKGTGKFRPHLRNPAKEVEIKIAERKFELRHFVQADGTKGARVYRVEVIAE